MPDTVIRPMTLDELPSCDLFGRAFHEEKAVPGVFSIEVFVRNWTLFMQSGLGAIFGLWHDGRLVGGLGGLVVPDITTGENVANEFFWYVTPEARGTKGSIQLVNEFTEWAQFKGATRLRMAHMLTHGEGPSIVKLDSFYRKRGLRPVEVIYDGVI